MIQPGGSPCDGMTLLIQADHDGELDAASTAAMLAHVGSCPRCAALRDRLTALSASLREGGLAYAAPGTLRDRVARLARPDRGGLRGWVRRQGAGLAVGAALAACVTVAVVPRPRPADAEAEALVGGHIRALQPGHLMDVVSTDRHTVKPWFDGRLDYAPPVRDFAQAGFPLKGGRLDTLGLRPVSVLVYGSDKHLIDVTIVPATAGTEGMGSVHGYNIVRWYADGMRFWAVSDLNAADLARFRSLWRAR